MSKIDLYREDAMKIVNVIGYNYSSAKPHWPGGVYSRTNRLYYIHGGSGGYVHNGKEGVFEVGKLYFIPFADTYTCYTDADDPIIHTYFDFDLLPPVLTKKLLCADISNDPMLAAALDTFNGCARLISENKLTLAQLKADESLFAFVSGAILHIISYIINENNIPLIDDERIITALDIIHTRMHEPLSVVMLADACGMNKDSFIRRFTRVIGSTPYAYLKNLRIRTANILKEDGVKLSEIARLTGYADPSSLIHALKK